MLFGTERFKEVKCKMLDYLKPSTYPCDWDRIPKYRVHNPFTLWQICTALFN